MDANNACTNDRDCILVGQARPCDCLPAIEGLQTPVASHAREETERRLAEYHASDCVRDGYLPALCDAPPYAFAACENGTCKGSWPAGQAFCNMPSEPIDDDTTRDAGDGTTTDAGTMADAGATTMDVGESVDAG